LPGNQSSSSRALAVTEPFHSTLDIPALVHSAGKLIVASLAPATRAAYNASWNKFKNFAKRLNGVNWFPSSVATVALFISELMSVTISPSPATLATTMSAIAYYHKLSGAYDLTSDFIVWKILKGVSKSKPSGDSCLPVTPHMLQYLIKSTLHIAASPYEAVLAAAIYT